MRRVKRRGRWSDESSTGTGQRPGDRADWRGRRAGLTRHTTSCAEKTLLNENTPTVQKRPAGVVFLTVNCAHKYLNGDNLEWLTVFTYTFIDILTTCLLCIHYLIAFLVLKSLSQPYVNQTLLFPWGGGCDADGGGQAIVFSASIDQRGAWMEPPVPSAQWHR